MLTSILLVSQALAGVTINFHDIEGHPFTIPDPWTPVAADDPARPPGTDALLLVGTGEGAARTFIGLGVQALSCDGLFSRLRAPDLQGADGPSPLGDKWRRLSAGRALEDCSDTTAGSVSLIWPAGDPGTHRTEVLALGRALAAAIQGATRASPETVELEDETFVILPAGWTVASYTDDDEPIVELGTKDLYYTGLIRTTWGDCEDALDLDSAFDLETTPAPEVGPAWSALVEDETAYGLCTVVGDTAIRFDHGPFFNPAAAFERAKEMFEAVRSAYLDGLPPETLTLSDGIAVALPRGWRPADGGITRLTVSGVVDRQLGVERGEAACRKVQKKAQKGDIYAVDAARWGRDADSACLDLAAGGSLLLRRLDVPAGEAIDEVEEAFAAQYPPRARKQPKERPDTEKQRYDKSLEVVTMTGLPLTVQVGAPDVVFSTGITTIVVGYRLPVALGMDWRLGVSSKGGVAAHGEVQLGFSAGRLFRDVVAPTLTTGVGFDGVGNRRPYTVFLPLELGLTTRISPMVALRPYARLTWNTNPARRHGTAAIPAADELSLGGQVVLARRTRHKGAGGVWIGGQWSQLQGDTRVGVEIGLGVGREGDVGNR